jgi:hypothetical protein
VRAKESPAVRAASDPGPRPELAWLPVERLIVDARFQRDAGSRRSRKHVERIAVNFRWSRFQAILVAQADHGWSIIDGQHRVAAAKMCGFDLVPAVVIAQADLCEQAQSFVWANRDRLTVSPQAAYHAQFAAGEPEAVVIDRLCHAAGIAILPYHIGANSVPAGKTTAIQAITACLRKHGEEIAGTAISIVASTWSDHAGALRAPFFTVVAETLAGGVAPRSAAALVRRPATVLARRGGNGSRQGTPASIDAVAAEDMGRRAVGTGPEAASGDR